MAACAVLWVGDSLAVGAAQQAGASYSCVPAQIGASSAAALQQVRRRDVRGARLAVSAGVNDDPRTAAFEERVRAVVARVGPDGRVAWATIAGGRHEAFNRALSREAALSHGRLVLVPWAREVALGRVRLGDGVHPGPSGYRVLARLFDRALR